MAEPIERPLPSGANAPAFGSDVIAETLRALDIPYIALNPGRELSRPARQLVNYLGNRAPQMLLCLHEESAVAIAHGYAKVTGRAMAAAVHSNVGLMHATMAIFNAWCDRMPVIVLGATGPVDARKRRPVDRLDPHRARSGRAGARLHQMGRPAGLAGRRARSAAARGWIANTTPQGPVYVNLDAEMQEAKLAEPLPPIDAARFMPPVASAPDAPAVAKAADVLSAREAAADPDRAACRATKSAGMRASRSPKASARRSSPI